ncbi:aminotransferase [Breznakia sp. PF5-3]|uniref:aminotransferase class I/II-fold pyridoxal phosphate-dependent enzyme n=1 Tax=unclassified Breznakia TaxID=2623764 RepID=UPI002404A422|nr:MULTISPECIES: aminotransferase class I/II-fold pyridoxal phosphate-dependent enzyme [unclassified Breznakia]MDF9824555.1 aminotransferase [Breznakia sp. PM6-1]MDF9835445.1 aminotransferase [Breznakia sp. PF5-3]
MDNSKKLSTLVNTIKPSGIRKFFDVAKQVEGAISLGVGEPDFDTPWHIREAAIYAIETGKTTYTENAGLLELREEICKYQERRFGLTYDPQNEALVTVGGSEAIDTCFRAILNPGDEVIVPMPSYVAYEPAVILAGGVCKHLELTSEHEFKITKEMLLSCISDKTKAILLNYPSNPTGGTMSKQDYAELVPIIKEHELIVISDEIYADLIYEGKHTSLACFDEIKEQVIIISGCSKAFAMTGWRLGYILGNKTFIQAITKIHQYTIMCAPIMSQYAAIEGFKSGENNVEEMRIAYKGRRNFIVEGFNKLGLNTHMPKGAFYIFPDIRSTGLTSEQFCEELLKDQKVACVPGTAFGEAGEGFIRVSYAYSIDEIKIALDRIENFLNKRK